MVDAKEKRQVLTIRMFREEHALVKQVAAKSGLSINAFCRMVLLDAARRELSYSEGPRK